MLAILFTVHTFSDWLYGNKFMIYLDHTALSYLFTSNSKNYTLNYWALLISEYNFMIVHHPDIYMILENCLSQLYPRSFWDNSSLTPPSIPFDTPCLAQRKPHDLKALTLVDNSLCTAKSALNRHIKGRLNKQLPFTSEWKHLLQLFHTEGHHGAETLFVKIWNKGYYWPTLHADCSRTCQQCNDCLKHNVTKHGFHPLKTIHATYPFDHVANDLFGPLPTSSKGFNYVLVTTNIATWFTSLCPVHAKTAKETTALSSSTQSLKLSRHSLALSTSSSQPITLKLMEPQKAMSSWHTTPLTSLLTAIGPTGTPFYLLPNMQLTNT
ncbi:hypothetical protein QOT17_25584 [Balamuthia mandrillaris]